MTDVLIIGGGIIGLATAIALSQKGANVTVVERDICGRGATWAAAGMLAPEAERLEGDLLEFGIRSREMYPQWIANLMRLSGQDCGYWCCGMIAPVLEESDRQVISQHPKYINREESRKRQSGLGEAILGSLWLPEDGQVNNRKLTQALLTTARSLSIKILEGTTVYQIVRDQKRVTHLDTSAGKLQSDRYVLATGAWTRSLLPLPIKPIKGQMLSVFDGDRKLQRVIYAPSCYIVPRQDGTIVIGATVEDNGFSQGNTAAGIAQLLNRAIAVYPAIADMQITETWWGFRPHAPNEVPLLGASDYENLVLATGHYRNGILFAPITAKLITDFMVDGITDSIYLQ
ncbi:MULTISPECIES: glycine oxidase ThiO [Pseudanabaena]|uniref:glycine oxidase ThiO n=1 Tax=Pseudanabaena TaxID=1152 RepID=UPI0024789E06|nr:MULTISPECIES: glycine oxidase ThiO [Pseudanabaena]MEA5485263.1 glycine oxidase ThiO [Pseudanabaena sp. CCNP1317]WGS72606.1 glycine oxidase ThiO [Pseudanabaena galeata CCNP1313]